MFKKVIKAEVLFWCAIALLSLITSCKNETDMKVLASNEDATEVSNTNITRKKDLSQEFKDYWYAGKAEITSYKLEQARYGEIRDGHAVLIYVTEDFLPTKQVKADRQHPNNIPILKLNATKNFNTGIYPYSIMQSTFYPVSNNSHALKVTNSIQEWCGHVYMQLNNKETFKVMSHSYFESEADQNFQLDKSILENELWAKLRINPKSLPTGDLQIIPAFEYARLRHVPVKAYNATATLSSNSYTISYPTLNRTLTINFSSDFPYEIQGWEERFTSGFGSNAKTLITKASKLKTIKSAYWQKNSNVNNVLRHTLQLN